jgi:class 3 adenylate cyclase/tetratricopeptide (TPR) repeat protein
VPSTCSHCGFENPRGFKFCGECARPLAGDSGSATREREPRAYTPKHLADKILQSKSALEGERKQVTVLFADIKSSMDLQEGMDPEAWHRILNRFFEILTDGVHRFEGTVNQYTGDGIMALFGAPIAHEDHAQRACYAALRLTEDLRRYANELRLRQGLNFSVRMGLNSGEVVVGKIGDDLRMDYTAQGRTVGLAARMEQLAEPGKVYLTEHTAALVSGYFELEDLGRFDIPGVRESAGVYALQGVGRLRTRLDVSRARGFSKFVGRDDEMATLDAALERAMQGNGQVVGVVGEAGVGKSRLCFEFAERCRARDLALYEGHAVAHGKAVPFIPMLELFRGYFGITEQDSDEIARDKIAGRSLRLDESLSEALPLLFDFLGVPDPRKPPPNMDPEARQRELFGIIGRLTHARSQREPAVFLMEDLHWIDGGSEGFLEHMVDSLPGTRTLILVNFRPEYHAPWLQRSYYQQLPLVPLGPEAMVELLGDLLGSDPSVAGLADLIREHTGGNPFFIEEVVQSLVEAGTLDGMKNAYRLVQPMARLTVPGTVQAVLAARIDRLPEQEKQVLQTASVIGKKFSEPVLRKVVELPERDLADATRILIASEFIYEETLYPDVEYAFKHPLTRDVAYDSQLSERRGRVHRTVAQALEVLDPTKLDERAALIAHHWEEAGDALQAARWYRRAAVWTGMNNLIEAYRHWQRVRELLNRLPESEETIEQGAEARAQLIWMAIRVGGAEEDVAPLVQEAKELATRSGDPGVLGRVLTSDGVLRLYSGKVNESLPVLDEAVRCADETEDRGLRVSARMNQVTAYGLAGRLRESLVRLEEVIELCQRDPHAGADLLGYSPHLYLLGIRGSFLIEMGRYSEAERELDRALALARERHAPLPEMLAQGMRVELCSAIGEAHGAQAHAQEAVNLAEKMANQAGRTFAYHRLGLAFALEGEWAPALNALGQSLAIAREHRTGRQFEAHILARLADVHRARGEHSKARATAEEAIGVARRDGAKLGEIEACIALARALSNAGDADLKDDIESTLESAMRLVDETGAETNRARIYEARGELARLVGDEETRERELREAHRLYVEMGATGHAERVARELDP